MPLVPQDRLLGFELRPAVDIDRRCFVGFVVPALLPVEDFSAGEKHEGNTLREPRQMSRRVHVDAAGFLGILLAVLGTTQSSAMNHRAGLEGPPCPFDLRSIGQIQIDMGKSSNVPVRRPSGGAVDEILSDQSCRPGH